MAGADAQHAGDELAEWHVGGDHTPGQVIRSFGLRNAAPANIWKHLGQQDSGDDAHQWRNGKEPETRRSEAEQPVARLFDSHRKRHGAEGCED